MLTNQVIALIHNILNPHQTSHKFVFRRYNAITIISNFGQLSGLLIIWGKSVLLSADEPKSHLLSFSTLILMLNI